jgi:hypothetical protein
MPIYNKETQMDIKLTNLCKQDRFHNDIKAIVKDICESNALKSNKIVSSYIFGSTIELLESGNKITSKDIDLLLILDNLIPVGSHPFRMSVINELSSSWLIQNKKTQVILNGVLPLSCIPDEAILDISWDCLKWIEGRDAHSVVLAKKPRLLITGQDVYATIIDVDITSKIIVDYLVSTKGYICREYSERKDINATYMIAKMGIVAAAALSNSTIVTNNKSFIVETIIAKYPGLEEHLVKLQEVYKTPSRYYTSDTLELFNRFIDILCETVRCCR